jgi:nanoRNase/pAp phosphatase (c-di-AMP/oligoRNAs hydrolase)
MISTEPFLNDCCHKLLEEEGYKIVFNVNPRTKHISVRHNIENFHVGEFLQKLNLGGGHQFAGAFSSDDFSTIKKRVNFFVDSYIYTVM